MLLVTIGEEYDDDDTYSYSDIYVGEEDHTEEVNPWINQQWETEQPTAPTNATHHARITGPFSKPAAGPPSKPTPARAGPFSKRVQVADAESTALADAVWHDNKATDRQRKPTQPSMTQQQQGIQSFRDTMSSHRARAADSASAVNSALTPPYHPKLTIHDSDSDSEDEDVKAQRWNEGVRLKGKPIHSESTHSPIVTTTNITLVERSEMMQKDQGISDDEEEEEETTEGNVLSEEQEWMHETSNVSDLSHDVEYDASDDDNDSMMAIRDIIGLTHTPYSTYSPQIRQQISDLHHREMARGHPPDRPHSHSNAHAADTTPSRTANSTASTDTDSTNEVMPPPYLQQRVPGWIVLLFHTLRIK